jgi:uronate dehydrogenase
MRESRGVSIYLPSILVKVSTNSRRCLVIVSNIVAITGAAGYLGRLTRRHLSGPSRRLKLLDIADMEPAGERETVIQASLTDTDAIARLVEGVDVVIHLAADLSVDDWAGVLASNLEGTYNVYEAARAAGVRRIVFASSHHIAGMYPSRVVTDTRAPHRPDSLYGLSKGFGEDLAQYYWDKFGLESVALRIGSARPRPVDPRERYTWLSEPDYFRLIDACLTAPRVGFTPVWGVSANTRVWWDNRHAAHLGFVPRDNADDHMPAPAPLDAAAGRLLAYQGGKRSLHRLAEPADERLA